MFTRSAVALVAVLALAGCGSPSQEPLPGIVPADSIVRDSGNSGNSGGSRDEPLREIPPREKPLAAAPERSAPAAKPTPQPRRGVEPEEAVRLGVRTVAGFGRLVVDGEGFVLYRFDGDKPNEVRCDAVCNKVWVPVFGTLVVPSGEIDRADLAIVERADGLHQVTLGGAPLYRYVNDRSRGSTRGHGIEKAWWAVAADGSRAVQKPEAGGAG